VSYAVQHGGPLLRSAAGLAGAAAGAVSKTLAKYAKGKADTLVYLAMRNSKAVYAGITNNLRTRFNEHKAAGKGFDALRPITPKLPRSQALAIETTIILSNPHFENINCSVGKNNPEHLSAVHAGTSWLLRAGVAFVY
jgi:hypothetical protein